MIVKIEIFSKEDFRNWLSENHDKEKIVELVIHKKHTGKPSPSHKELMFEGICYGWIDTVVRRIDEDKYIRTFQRRNEKSKWSVNTLGYAEKLIEENRMTPHGLKFYKEGKRKKPFDHGIPKDPKPPRYLLDELEINKVRDKFDGLSYSKRKIHIKWLLMAKLEKTRKERIKKIIKTILEED